jgi:hypothetical protein
MGGMLLGKVVARNCEDKVTGNGSCWDPKDGAGEERTGGLGRSQTLELACGCREDLASKSSWM